MEEDSTETVDVPDDEMDEELGYADCDWSRLDAASVAQHDRLLDVSYEELDAVDFDQVDDLARWAGAQAFWDYGDEDRFHDLALRIVRSKDQHPAIDYTEICLELANDYMLDGAWDEAVFLLPDVERLIPEDPTIRARFGALISIGRDRRDEGMAVFQELAEQNEDDGAVLFLLAQDLYGAGEDEAADSLLAKAEEVASLANDREVLEDIADLREDLEAED